MAVKKMRGIPEKTMCEPMGKAIGQCDPGLLPRLRQQRARLSFALNRLRGIEGALAPTVAGDDGCPTADDALGIVCQSSELLDEIEATLSRIEDVLDIGPVEKDCDE